jgi:type I restriction enzyme S subunit
MTSNDWKEVTLGEISLDGKGSYGIAASAVEYSDDLYTYLRITDINDDGTLNKTDLKSVDDEKAEKYLLQPNDIVFARTGNSTGRSYFYDGSDGELVYAGFLIKFSLDPSKVNPKFMRYYTLSNEYKGWVSSYISGSTRGNINAKTYANMKISLPPRKQQDYLVKVLSSLDEKIETNNQINEKLEQIAQALFKHWFVDFEFPNENGKPYKSSGGEMVESELGMIPKGWKIVKLGDVIDFQNGYAFKSKDLLDVESDSTFRVFKMGNIKKGGGINHSGTKSYIERDKCQNLSNYIIKKGDLLMCMTDMKSNVALLGHTALMDRDNEYILNQRVGLIRTKDSKVINFPYLYILTNSEDFINNLRSRANSGVQVNLSTKEIKDSLICLPDQKVHSLFNEITERMFEKSFQVEDENQKLTLIRDNLLPKLMSGEIRVPLDDEVLSEKN